MVDYIVMCDCPICSASPAIKHILPSSSRFISSSATCSQCGLNIVSEKYFDNKENRDKFDRHITSLWNRMGVTDKPEPFSEREYKIVYIDNGKRYLCGKAKHIDDAEEIRLQRIKDLPGYEITILEKEIVCREIRYT